ncbi:MAG: hypothetical protein Q4C25_02470 [Bacillota bacterium]|nr:hypothetical protein [Bacillota bacterium]
MGKKKRGAVPTNPPRKKEALRIDMNKANLKKEYVVPGFQTGKHMTDKDRPRKKNWKKEYEREPQNYRDDKNRGSFSFPEKDVRIS